MKLAAWLLPSCEQISCIWLERGRGFKGMAMGLAIGKVQDINNVGLGYNNDSLKIYCAYSCGL